MPANIGPLSGNECKLYYQPTLATTFTIANSVLITEAQDVNLSVTTGTTDAASRISNFKAKLPTLTELSLTFGYLWNGDVGDTQITALRTAFLARTVWHWAVMDNLNTTSVGPPAIPGPKGSQGLTFPGIITEFVLDQPLEGAVKVDVKVDLVRVKVSNNILDPAWLTIAAN
jgi:hypothetical protein